MFLNVKIYSTRNNYCSSQLTVFCLLLYFVIRISRMNPMPRPIDRGNNGKKTRKDRTGQDRLDKEKSVLNEEIQ